MDKLIHTFELVSESGEIREFTVEPGCWNEYAGRTFGEKVFIENEKVEIKRYKDLPNCWVEFIWF